MGTPVIGIDGDDTLWHSEGHFVTTTARLTGLLDPWIPHTEAAQERLITVERRNLDRFGYGVKAFTLSMIETAIEISDAQVSAREIQQILDWSKELLDHPVELLDGVRDAISALAADHRLLLITKGDLLHQESKVARSELAEHFEGVHIVSEKDPATYQRVLDRHDIAARDFVMVGNSLRSDILPVIEIGGRGVHVPYHTTWALELVEESDLPAEVHRIERLGELAGLLDRWMPS